jgi:hypothetical protein
MKTEERTSRFKRKKQPAPVDVVGTTSAIKKNKVFNKKSSELVLINVGIISTTENNAATRNKIRKSLSP